MKRRVYTAVIQKRGAWYVGFVEELAGVNSQGRTPGEVRRNLREAIRLIVRANRELARGVSAGAVREEIVVTA